VPKRNSGPSHDQTLNISTPGGRPDRALSPPGANTTKDGQPYHGRYCFVFRVSDGKLAELTEYMDSALVSAVLGDP
jgi:ketosteroid isomerase-like protein